MWIVVEASSETRARLSADAHPDSVCELVDAILHPFAGLIVKNELLGFSTCCLQAAQAFSLDGNARTDH